MDVNLPHTILLCIVYIIDSSIACYESTKHYECLSTVCSALNQGMASYIARCRGPAALYFEGKEQHRYPLIQRAKEQHSYPLIQRAKEQHSYPLIQRAWSVETFILGCEFVVSFPDPNVLCSVRTFGSVYKTNVLKWYRIQDMIILPTWGMTWSLPMEQSCHGI